jgi:NADH:ubiquinone oxidoreductase subunit H
LLRILKETNIVLKKDIRFWVLSGIVLYAVATFFFFGYFTPMLISSRKLLKAIWFFNDAFIVMQFIFFLRAFLCKPASAGITNTSPITHKE